MDLQFGIGSKFGVSLKFGVCQKFYVFQNEYEHTWIIFGVFTDLNETLQLYLILQIKKFQLHMY